jgi:16S rRNA (guanine966-N2)-methyltransferase
MRVIAGKYRSRPLRSMPGLDIRPTSDRLRETLFNVLTGGDPNALEGTTWIDLFAGTGAVGIEAMSRGAAQVYLAEKSPAAAKLIAQNLKSLQIATGFQVLQQDAIRVVRSLREKGLSADVVFLDPPYNLESVYGQCLDELSIPGLLGPESLVIAEHHKKFDPGEMRGGLKRYRKLQQGDAALSFYALT